MLKWAIVFLAIVAVIVAGVYLRRDQTAAYLANTALAESGLEVTSLSVDRLDPGTIELSGIVISAGAGGSYRIADLQLKLSRLGTKLERVAASRVAIEPGTQEAGPTDLGAMLETVVGLPMLLPDIKARIASLSIGKLPQLSELVWRSTAGAQVFEASLGDAKVTLSSAPVNASTHSLTLAAVSGGSDSVLAIDAAITVDGDRRSIDGTAVFQTTEWIPILQQFELLPGELERFDARFRGDISVVLDEPAAGEASISSHFKLVDQVNAAYWVGENDSATIVVDAMSPLKLLATYPAGNWSMTTASAAGHASAPGVEAVPLVARDIDCRSGIRCEMTLAVEAAGQTIGGVEIGSLSLSAPMLLEATRLVIDPALSFSARDLSLGNFAAERAEIAGFSGAIVESGDDASEFMADGLRLGISGLNLDNTLIDALALDVRELRLGSRSMAASVAVPAGASLSRDGLSVLLPGLEGGVHFEDQRIDAELSLSDIFSAVTGDITVSHRLDLQTGAASMRNLRIEFDSVGLSDYIDGWTEAFDIVGGRCAADITLEWEPAEDGLAMTGRIDSAIDSISGVYDDYAFVDADTRILASLDADGLLSVEPSSLSVALIDIGLPLSDFTADYSLDVSGQAVRVENLSLAVLGGEFSADPFVYSAQADANSIVLHARAIELQLMVEVAEFEDLEITGSISGSMPLTFSGDGVRVDSGTLQSDGSGGVIRFEAGSGTLDGVAPDSDLSVVTRSLSNFEYDSLSSQVEYSNAGDLSLKMRLSGINPDVDATQPIILNLSIENNVPQTLRSLRSIRSIEDILEKRAAK